MDNLKDFQIENGKLIKYLGKKSHVIIPNTVLSIENFAFKGCQQLKSIFIPATVNFIGYYVVADCAFLEKIEVDKDNKTYYSNGSCIINKQERSLVVGCKNSVIPNDNTILAIDKFAFSNCVALESIVIPNSVKQIRDYAFIGCYNLEKAVLPNSLNYIGKQAFEGCESLESIVIPHSVTCISDNVFYECKNLTSVTAMDDLCSIGFNVFDGCNKNLVITTTKNSYALEYATKNKIKVKIV